MSSLTPRRSRTSFRARLQIQEADGHARSSTPARPPAPKVAGAGLTTDERRQIPASSTGPTPWRPTPAPSPRTSPRSPPESPVSAAGCEQLDTGAGKIEDGVDQLASNGTKLAKGTKSLATGLGQLADGTDQLATGLTTLSNGIQQTATGTSELADGTSQSATGGRQLSDGLVKLADGGSQLADGADELATGLEKGAKQIPTYDKQTRTALSSVVATPVTAERPSSLFADIANTTFLAILALWLGGLASFVVLRAIPARVLTSMKPSWRLAGEALLPAAGIAAVQAIALTAVLQILLGLSAGQVLALLPFTVLAGLTFVAVNHALVAWLGGVGRFVSIAAVVLATASAITQAVPPFLGQIVPFLPLTPALEGARAIATDSGGAGGSAGLLLAWLLAGLAAGVLAVARHRMAKVPEVAPVRVSRRLEPELGGGRLCQDGLTTQHDQERPCQRTGSSSSSTPRSGTSSPPTSSTSPVPSTTTP